jgi:SEL1 protein
LWEETIAGLIESAAIIGLAVALAILVVYRRQRGEQRRLAEERVRFVMDQGQDQQRGRQDGDVAQDGQGGEQRRDEEDRGLFPRQGDAEFMDWAVGGVGH